MLTKPSTRRPAVWVLLVAALALHPGSEFLFAQPAGAPAVDHLGAVFSYYLKGGGVWRQENAKHEAGSGSPVAYVKRYEWGPGRSTVLDDTFALMEDGECRPWTHNVFHWDIAEGAVRAQIFHLSGAWFTGLIRMAGEHQSTAELSGILPDGKVLKMRDRTDRSDPHEVVIRASIADGETWKEADQVSWIHVAAPGKPCGF